VTGAADAGRRVTLVTGASRGIGRAAALALAADGAHVVALARSQKALAALDDEMRAACGRAATLIPLDLRDGAAIDGLAAALLERFGRLDGLLANAGVLGTLGPLHQVTPQSFAETIDVNLTANWRLIRALHPLLRASPAGRAVFVTSGAAPRPRAYWGPYAASKAALEAMVVTYADETEATPIRVNLFDPGATRTEMRFKAMPGEDPASLPTAAEVAAALPPLLVAGCAVHGQRIVWRELARSATSGS
jgi:NAD(P)-dependent dehydrogenase (short-subunit alcohol dehydrogenase family)